MSEFCGRHAMTLTRIASLIDAQSNVLLWILNKSRGVHRLDLQDRAVRPFVITVAARQTFFWIAIDVEHPRLCLEVEQRGNDLILRFDRRLSEGVLDCKIRNPQLRLSYRTWGRRSESRAATLGFSGYLGGLVKHHQPLPIAIYENVGAIIEAVASFARLLAPTRFLDAMNPGDRAADIDLVHLHRNAELLERWPVALPIPLDRRPTNMFLRIFRGGNKDVIPGARPNQCHGAYVARRQCFIIGQISGLKLFNFG